MRRVGVDVKTEGEQGGGGGLLKAQSCRKITASLHHPVILILHIHAQLHFVFTFRHKSIIFYISDALNVHVITVKITCSVNTFFVSGSC